ncbi:MAG TPA: hypothetical protein VGN81_39315 [Pseudonocardiaceae bacterium]|jgi:hypothetical protein
MSTSPSSGSYQVALDALHADAGVWQRAGSTITTAQQAATGENLTAAQFSYWADGQGVTSSYTQVQKKIAQLLSGASANFQNIGTTLLGVATEYTENEKKVAGSFDKVGH